MRAGAGARAVAAVGAFILVAGCTTASSAAGSYPMPADPPTSTQVNSATIGEPLRAVLLYLEIRPGDRLELLDGSAIGSIEGATVTLLLSRPLTDADGNHVIGEQFEPLEGAVVAPTAVPAQDHTVGIAAELIPARPGRYVVEDLRLRYRLNGGPEQTGAGIDVVWTVCADDPAPADCPEAPAS